MAITLRLFFTSALLASVVLATPEGAPGTACVHMTPDHNTTAQNDFPHFTTEPNTREIGADGVVTLTIAAHHDSKHGVTFKGYLVIATMYMPDMPDMTHIVGAFRNPSDGKIIDCILSETSRVPSGAVTHDDKEEKTSVTVEWIPNGFTGDVIFKTTYVQDVSTFWVKQQADVMVRVKSATGAATSLHSKSSLFTSLLVGLFLFVTILLLL